MNKNVSTFMNWLKTIFWIQAKSIGIIEKTREDFQDPNEYYNYKFYKKGLMPCCNKIISFQTGPRGGEATNIKCAHCKEEWNICPYTSKSGFIEKINGWKTKKEVVI